MPDPNDRDELDAALCLIKLTQMYVLILQCPSISFAVDSQPKYTASKSHSRALAERMEFTQHMPHAWWPRKAAHHCFTSSGLPQKYVRHL